MSVHFDSALLTFLAWLSIPAAIVLMNLLLRWVVAHTNLGTRRYRSIDPDELVTIAEFTDYVKAELWKGRLQAVGIECAVEGGTMAGMIAPLFLAGRGGLLRPGVKLLVHAADAQRAWQVLRAG